MTTIIHRTEGEGLPPDADGVVVARNDSGGRVVWCAAHAYVPTHAPPRTIVNGDWRIAIERASTVARAQAAPVYVIKD